MPDLIAYLSPPLSVPRLSAWFRLRRWWAKVWQDIKDVI